MSPTLATCPIARATIVDEGDRADARSQFCVPKLRNVGLAPSQAPTRSTKMFLHTNAQGAAMRPASPRHSGFSHSRCPSLRAQPCRPGLRARLNGSASAQAASRAMGAAVDRRSHRMGALSPSTRMPPTWCRAIPTINLTRSSATAKRQDPAGQRQLGRRPGQWEQLQPGTLRRRALCRLLLGCHQPRGG